MMTYSRLPIAVLAATGLAFGAVLAGPIATPAAQAQAQASYSDAKLQSFAQAAVKLIGIRSEFQSKMSEMSSDQERSQLQQQTSQRMAMAVKDTDGISVEEYNEIAAASRSDEALAEKINGYIKETAN